MSVGDQFRDRWPKDWPLQLVPRAAWTQQRPTYGQAQPSIINAALERSQRRPTGNWYVFAASTDVRSTRPLGARVAGVELVAWRDRLGHLTVGPASCPHLGADLATGTVADGVLFCRWHGLALDGNSCKLGWAPLPSYDDGVLAWVRLDAVGGETPRDVPVIPDRPTGSTLPAVARVDGTCEPQDIIANRLDPWHGSWFHPYSFTRLEVLTTPTEEDDRFVVSVTFRVGRFGVPTIAEFTCPDARTIVMRIVEGEGAGSVVETHATPVGPGPDGHPRVAVIEAVVAHSQRPGFKAALSVAPLVAPLMRYAANRLWRDDLAYAERRYRLRSGD
ncbi:MAG: Rieske (2Fe-2S) protein [Mycobacterium sp.]|nr:MAG: Rieske (2Fe-2S) protein [Mycobacterium sp.]